MRMPMVGAAGAMGRSAAPTFTGSNLFPGASYPFPNWVAPAAAGAGLGQQLDAQGRPAPQLPLHPQFPQAPKDTQQNNFDLSDTQYPVKRGGGPGMPIPGVQGPQAGVLGWINSRGGHTMGVGAPPMQPEFAARVAAAGRAYEAETGQRAVFDETGRSHEYQGELRRRYEAGTGGLAARPYESRHEIGQGIDIPHGPFQEWMHRNARRFGLQGLNDPRDTNHFQLDRSYSGRTFAT